MSESHHIVGGVTAEPLPAGRVGARLRVPLSGMPSRRWSRALSAHLSTDLAGRSAVGHLLIDDIVQGSDLVLEGVEDPGAPALGPALEQAVAAANRACEGTDHGAPATNMPQEHADAIAEQVGLDGPSGGRRTAAGTPPTGR